MRRKPDFYPPGYRAPGSDLIVIRATGLNRRDSIHDSGRELETVCIRPRPEKGGEPCGNKRLILVKRLKKAKACAACSGRLKARGRITREKVFPTDKAKIKERLELITPRNLERKLAELEQEGGARWAEFESIRDRRLALKASGEPEYRDAWNVARQIEALQVVYCSPESGACCEFHASGGESDRIPYERKEDESL